MARQFIYHMQGLTKAFSGGKKVLENINLSFYPDAKIGVLGPNGSGKSTLLKIMAGLDKEFTGEAWAAEGAKVGMLEQEPKLDPKKDVLGNVMDGAGEMARMLARFEEVSNAFSEPDADMDKLIAEQAEIGQRQGQDGGFRQHACAFLPSSLNPFDGAATSAPTHLTRSSRSRRWPRISTFTS